MVASRYVDDSGLTALERRSAINETCRGGCA